MVYKKGNCPAAIPPSMDEASGYGCGEQMEVREVADKVSTNALHLVEAFYERIWNAGDLAAVNDLLAVDFAFRGSLGPQMRGHQAFCEYVKSVRDALSEYRCDILESVTEADKVFAKMRFSGVHAGTFRGHAPSGKSVQWLGAALFRVQAGQIAELWVLGDLISLEADLQRNAASG